VKIIQAYRFALDPTPEQERALRSHAGAARFAWNWGLAQCRTRYAAEKTWRVPWLRCENLPVVPWDLQARCSRGAWRSPRISLLDGDEAATTKGCALRTVLPE
jgi:transposase